MIRSNQKAAVYKIKDIRQGSITVFASLTLLLVASFLLTLLEAARVKGLDAYAGMNRVNALESVFSEYNRTLFEEYGIFLMDGSYGSGTLDLSEINGRLQAVSQKNLRPAVSDAFGRSTQNFYQMDVRDASVTNYLLATDYEGAPFRQMAAASMKARYPLEAAQKLYEQLRVADHAMEQAKQSQSAMEDAQANIEAAKNEQAQANAAAAEAAELPAVSETPVENPIEVIKKLKDMDLLTMVLPPGSNVSSKSIKREETLEHRSLQQGNETWQMQGSWYEDLLYQQFLQTHFSCFTASVVKDGALDYELEYIQAGKSSDRENLKKVVQELLLLREGVNFLYLQTDSVKKQEAYSIALALLGATSLAAFAGVVAQGILAAWAYGESILDVRTLLAGGKIPWVKTAENWNSSLSGLGSLLVGTAKAKEQDNGEDYEGYLKKLLYLKSAKLLNYRAMDLLEQRLRKRAGCEWFQMDAMIVSIRADFTYEAIPLFSEMVTIRRLSADRWEFFQSEYYSYLPED